MAKTTLKILIVALLIFLFYSCGSSRRHSADFDLQRQITDKQIDTTKTVYIVDTKPIDSVDVNKLIYDIFKIEIDEYPEKLKVYARVYDSLGNFVTNMARPYLKDTTKNYWTYYREVLGDKIKRDAAIDTFTVREYGANDSIPYNIVLTVDYSGSMSPVMKAIFEGTELFVRLKSKYDKIALTSYNQKYSVKVPFAKDTNDIISLYRMKRTEGIGLFSAMYDAVFNSIDLFRETEPEVPRVLVLFSDGDDNYSKKEIGEIIDSAKSQNVHIFTVAFGYSKDAYLKSMAQYTGGKFYRAQSQEELVSIFRDIYMSLKYYYYITYKPPKFWGLHNVIAAMNLPGRADTIFAYGEYNTSDLFDWDKIGKSFTRPILFDFDSAIVKPESYPIIEEIVDAMLSKPSLKLEIQGHTDNVGKIDYNLDLSDRRAKAVMQKIIEGGVEERRLRARGFGMSKPIKPNETEEGRADNRRTEFVIIAK